MGSKGQTTSTYTPAPAIGGSGTQAISMAQNAVQAPFSQPAAPVAGFTPDQLAAFQNVRNTQGYAQPYFDVGSNYLAQSAQPISGQQVQSYLNPYANYVMGNMNEVFGQQRRDTTGKLQALAGGPGASRIAVGQGELARQQALGAGQTMSGIYQQALTAAEQEAQRKASAGYGFASMGPAAQNSALQAINAQLGTGGLQQQLGQAQLMSPYQQQLAQLAYPYQQAQFLSGITSQLAPSQGGTTVKQEPPPSIWSQIGGLGLAGMGLFGNPFSSLGKGTGGGGMNSRGGRIRSFADGGNTSGAKGSLPFGLGGLSGQEQSPYTSPWAWQLPSYSVMRDQQQTQTPQMPMQPPATPANATPLPINSPSPYAAPATAMAQTLQPNPAMSQLASTPQPQQPYTPPPQPAENASLQDILKNSPAAGMQIDPGLLKLASMGQQTPQAPDQSQIMQNPMVAGMLSNPAFEQMFGKGFAEGGEIEFEDPATASPYLPPPPSMHIDEYMPNDIPAMGMTPFQMPPQVQLPPMPQTGPFPPQRPAGLPAFPPQEATPDMGPDIVPDAPRNRWAETEQELPPEAMPVSDQDPEQMEGHLGQPSPFAPARSANTSEALIAAGLGMMAGTSPYAGVNIGRGGLEALKNVQQQRALAQKERHDDMTIGQRANQLMQQAKQFTQTHEERQRHNRTSEEISGKRADTGRFSLIPGTGKDPETGQDVPGAYKLNSKTGEYEFQPNVTLVGKQTGPGAIERIAKQLREADPNLSVAESIERARKSPHQTSDRLRLESLAASAAKKEMDGMVGKKFDPEAIVQKWRKFYKLPEDTGSILTPPSAVATPTATPPLDKLAEGKVTTFKNGQKWTLRNGKAEQVE